LIEHWDDVCVPSINRQSVCTFVRALLLAWRRFCYASLAARGSFEDAFADCDFAYQLGARSAGDLTAGDPYSALAGWGSASCVSAVDVLVVQVECDASCFRDPAVVAAGHCKVHLVALAIALAAGGPCAGGVTAFHKAALHGYNCLAFQGGPGLDEVAALQNLAVIGAFDRNGVGGRGIESYHVLACRAGC